MSEGDELKTPDWTRLAPAAVHYLLDPIVTLFVPWLLFKDSGYSSPIITAFFALPSAVALLVIIRSWGMYLTCHPLLCMPDVETDGMAILLTLLGLIPMTSVLLDEIWLWAADASTRGLWELPVFLTLGILLVWLGRLLHLRDLPPLDQWPRA